MLGRTSDHYWGTVLDCPDARALATFYSRLLGWPIHRHEPEWSTIKPDDGVAYVAFQTSPEYVRPVWPPVDGKQQMMMHLDIEVPDLDAAVEQAEEVGAVLADFQPQSDVRIMLDPAGHPFCLYTSD